MGHHLEIDHLDLNDIKHRIIRVNGWLENEAEEAVKRYKKFLILFKKFPGVQFVPSSEIDLVWHHHIIDTKRYQNDCQKIFGKLLDHIPESHIETRSKLDSDKHFELTKKLYFETFGETMAISIRPRHWFGRFLKYVLFRKFLKRG